MLQRLLYTFISFLARIACHTLLRLRVKGRRFIPPKGPLIVAPTHSSFADPVVSTVVVSRHLTFMAKSFLFEPFFFGRLIRTLGAFPLDTDAGELGAIRLSLRLLKENKAVLIFPEGGRIRIDGLGKPAPGIGMLSVKSGAPVLPVYIHGSHDSLSLLFKGKLPRVWAYVAPPISFSPARKGTGKAEYYQQVSERVMRELWRMRCWHRMEHGLPPEPFGVWVEDPKEDRPPPGEKWSIN